MCSRAGKKQNKNVVKNLVNKKPVRLDMTFAASSVIACQLMVVKSGVELFSVRQFINYFKKLIYVLSLFFCKLKVFFEFCRKFTSYFIRQALF